MTLVSWDASPVLKIPNFESLVTRGRNKKFINWRKCNIPHSLLMACQSLWEHEILRIPNLNCLVLTWGCNKFIVRAHSHNVYVFLMSNNCQVGWGHILWWSIFNNSLLELLNIPNLNSVILAGRDKEVYFLGCKAYRSYILSMALESSHTTKLKIRFFIVPQLDCIILRSW